MGWRWLSEAVVLAIHDEQLAEHGGSCGLRDGGLLSSALARPQNIVAYGKPSLFDLSAAYAFGIIKNHPFIDGNKRTGFLAAYVFLDINGYELAASEDDVVSVVLRIADGEMEEQDFATWLCEKAIPRAEGSSARRSKL